MTEQEIIGLYHHPKIKCMISATHGEGFVLPLFDFAQVGKPIVAPAWSSYLDFLSREEDDKLINAFLPVSFNLAKVPPHVVWEGVITPDAEWAYPHEGSFKHRIRQVRKNKKWFERAEKHAPHILDSLSETKIYEKLCASVEGENFGGSGDDNTDNIEVVDYE